MERDAPTGTMHHMMAATAAIIVVACASTPVPQSPSRSVVDDAAVTGQVEAALADSDPAKAREIHVETHDGVVQLRGFVEDSNEKCMMENVARSVAGVQDVTNELEVRSTAGAGREQR